MGLRSQVFRHVFQQIMLALLARVVFAQVHVSASAIPLVTRATPTAARQSLTEAYLAQPMLNGGWRSSNASLVATLDLEGVTMRRGELTTGMAGEGYVDRRHPHTYVHELMAGVRGSVASTALSLTAGKGFVPFGSDDPMMRPAVKYPINHHLAQILERAVIIAGARYGLATLEAATFNGDEPVDAASWPNMANFGDSWAARLTVGSDALQASGSYAFVRSPEDRNRQSLDQRKLHAAIKWNYTRAAQRFIGLAEWARSTEKSTSAVRFQSWLAEGQWQRSAWSAALRLERTDRPEEDRTSDPFRTARPAIDLTLAGATQWNVMTVTAARAVAVRRIRTSPFVEASVSRPHASATAAFQPKAFYGSENLWMVSIGARLSIGAGHEGMGYYGVRQPSMTTPAAPHHH